MLSGREVCFQPRQKSRQRAPQIPLRLFPLLCEWAGSEAVGPIWVGSVRRGSINDLGFLIVLIKQGSRLNRRVGKAEESDIGMIDEFSDFIRIFSLVLADDEKLNIVSFRQTFLILKAVVPACPSMNTFIIFMHKLQDNIFNFYLLCTCVFQCQ